MHIYLILRNTKNTMASVEHADVDDSDMEMEHDTIIPMASTSIDMKGNPSRILVSDSLANMEDDDEQPRFPKLSALQANGNSAEYRRVRCPPHRYTPLREHWEQILTPLVEYLKLQVSFIFNTINGLN